MFDFMPVGGTLAVLAILYLSFAYRLLPKSRAAAIDIDAALAANAYVTEVEIPEGWAFGRGRVADLRNAAGEAVVVVALLRGRQRIAFAASQPQAPDRATSCCWRASSRN
jgi:hypothetical protein